MVLKIKFTIFSVLILLSVNCGFSQNYKLIDEVIDFSETIYGVNDLLVNGLVYKLPDGRVKKHPYLFDDRWFRSTIYIGDKSFKDRFIKYDIEKDDIVLKLKSQFANYKLVRINKLNVDSFRLNQRV